MRGWRRGLAGHHGAQQRQTESSSPAAEYLKEWALGMRQRVENNQAEPGLSEPRKASA